MPIQRPNAVVYEETTTIETQPDLADLPCLVVGPAYQILDYADDKASCAETTAYGLVTQSIVPTATQTWVDPTAVVFAQPANIHVGGVLKSDSVTLYMDAVRAVIDTSDPAAGTVDYSVYTSGDNVFASKGATPGHHFGVAGVAIGDMLITQSPTSGDLLRTVKELCYTLTGAGGDAMALIANGVVPGDLLTIANDIATTSRNGLYTVKRVLSATALEVEEVVPGVGISSSDKTASVLITDAAGNVKVNTTATDLNDWCPLRVSGDFPETCGTGDKKFWRIERALSNVKMSASDITVSGNSITVKSALTTSISTLLSSCPITYAKIYFQYRALRTDLQQVTELSTESEILSTLGKYDARNPLCVGAIISKGNTTTSIKVYGINSDTDEYLAYMDFLDRISTEKEVYAVVPLTYDTSVLAVLNNMAISAANPNLALQYGTRQKFRAIIGAIDLVTVKDILAKIQAGNAAKDLSYKAVKNKLTLGGPKITEDPVNLVTLNVLPGFTIEVNNTVTTKVYTVGHLVDTHIVNLDPTGAVTQVVDMTSSDPGGAHETVVVKDLAGTTLKTYTSAAAGDLTVTGADRELYRELYVPGATFLADVLPGDILEIPKNPNAADWTSTYTYIVNNVESDERLLIVNNGPDQAATSTELPYGYMRILVSGAVALVSTSADQVYCHIYRNMSKSQQVTNMIEVAVSFFSKRLILCYPNLVDPSGLVDGSKTRTGTAPEVADPQPGYYLSCAVGGMTAGQPSQQGFTNLGIAGIDRIYNVSSYFNETQITDLSDGGVYVFQQDNPTALPYSIHEVTTDTTGLQTSEYMVIKNIDFVATTLLNTIFGFLGIWNVTDQTIEFLNQAEQDTIDVLKQRFVSRIGAPLISATILSTTQSTVSSDRVESYIDGNFPMVLNTIGLHLVS